MSRKGQETEIVSLNTEILSFDANDLNIEGLERRLELMVPFGCSILICPSGFTCPLNFSCDQFRSC